MENRALGVGEAKKTYGCLTVRYKQLRAFFARGCRLGDGHSTRKYVRGRSQKKGTSKTCLPWTAKKDLPIMSGGRKKTSLIAECSKKALERFQGAKICGQSADKYGKNPRLCGKTMPIMKGEDLPQGRAGGCGVSYAS